jgi:hypothetical protein
MSSKAETLLKKATSYEKLALYGDRKTYLEALAQSSFPDVDSIVQSINNARKNAVTSITNFWRQDPAAFPMSARTDYSALRYPAVDLSSASGEQLTTGMDQLVTALNGVYRALTNSNNQKSQDFAEQTVYPAADYLRSQVEKYKSVAGSLPKPSATPEAAPAGQPGAPAAKAPAQYDSGTINLLQSFLNNALRDQIIAGKRSPLVVDGVLGNDTTGALREWARSQNIPFTNVQSLINTALKSAR